MIKESNKIRLSLNLTTNFTTYMLVSGSFADCPQGLWDCLSNIEKDWINHQSVLRNARIVSQNTVSSQYRILSTLIMK